MIDEALELYVLGGRVSHSWCMCVVGHDRGGLGGTGMEVVDGMHVVQSLGVACMSGDAGALASAR